MNGWIPGLLVNVRCNNDGKLLTNGEDTKAITAYTTMYLAKKQGQNYNASAVMAKGYAYHLDHSSETSAYLDDMRNTQRLLLFRLVHALNKEQELAAPMVISYLMGWGDTYRSHHYFPLYWTSFVRALFDVFPDLHSRVQKRYVLQHADLSQTNESFCSPLLIANSSGHETVQSNEDTPVEGDGIDSLDTSGSTVSLDHTPTYEACTYLVVYVGGWTIRNCNDGRRFSRNSVCKKPGDRLPFSGTPARRLQRHSILHRHLRITHS